MKSFAVTVFACTFLLIGQEVHSRTLETQTVRDWKVYCKDNRYCIATTEGHSKDGEKMRFKLERSVKENSIIYVTTAPKPALQKGMKVKISAAGNDTVYSGNIKRVYDNNEMAFKEKTTSGLIKLLKEGRFGTVTVEFGGSIGTKSYDISLQGVSSALAFMDVVQGRLDRADAAIITGGEAYTSVSNYDLRNALGPVVEDDKSSADAPRDPEDNINYSSSENSTTSAPVAQNPVPNEESGLGETVINYEISQAPTKALLPGYRQLGCDFPAAIEAFGWHSVNIEPGVFLYFIACNLADANVPFYTVLEDAGRMTVLKFQEAGSATGDRISLISNPSWSKERDGITMYEYFSPNYDCGKHETHWFDLQSSTFYLSEARFKENCDGVQTDPLNYPLSWAGEGD